MIHNDLLSKYFIFWQKKTQQKTELIIKHCVDTTENKERKKNEIGKIILLY